MQSVLFALLTTPPAQAAAKESLLVELLQKPEQAAAFITLVGGAIVALIIGAAVKLEAARRTAREAVADKPTTALPPALPPSAETELQAMRARVMSTEAVLLETQQAITRIRAAMDANAREAAREEGALSAALVTERAENERLRAENAQLRDKGELMLRQLREHWSGE